MRNILLNSILIALLSSANLLAHAGSDFKPDAKLVERGRYIVKITGCNDCHSPGYSESEGKLPEGSWLKGNLVGFLGPWGTS
jgi:mono/diheme cytochrome c family protein